MSGEADGGIHTGAPAPPSVPVEPDLRSYLRVLHRRMWTVITATCVVTGLAVGFSIIQTKRYTATAQVLLEAPQSVQLNATGGSTDLTPTQVQTETSIITSAPVQAAVARALEVSAAPTVKVTPMGQTDVVAIAATDTGAARASRIANAYANAYIDFRRAHQVNNLLAAAGQIQSKITDLDRQVAVLNYELASTPPAQQSTLVAEREALLNQEAAFKAEQAQFQVNSGLQTGGAEVITPAAVPKSPSSPRPKRSAAVGGALGLILGVALAFGLEYLDGSIRSKDDLFDAAHGLPVLGSIPDVKEARDLGHPMLVTASAPRSPAAEAYRGLRTAIQFVGVQGPIRSLQLTSPNPDDGKTTTLANLGVVMAQAGQRVVMVGCDLRRPRLQAFFGADREVGFTSLLVGSCSLEEAVHPALPGLANLSILLAGPAAPNPSELLGSPAAARIFAQLRERFDLVLIDSPPLLPVTDAAVLAGQVDATLLVAMAGVTTAKQVEESLDLLERVGARVAGTVLNGVAKNSSGYAYAYGYEGYADLKEESQTPPDLMPVCLDTALGGAVVVAAPSGASSTGQAETAAGVVSRPARPSRPRV